MKFLRILHNPAFSHFWISLEGGKAVLQLGP